jgi:hypothetical protein
MPLPVYFSEKEGVNIHTKQDRFPAVDRHLPVMAEKF